MKSRIWHLAGLSLLCVSISTQALAGDDAPRDQIRGSAGAGQQREQPNAPQQMQQRQQQNLQQQQIQQQRGVERQQDQQMRDVERQQQQQIQQQQNQQRQVERQQQQQIRDVDRQQQQQIQQQQIQQRQVERQQQQQIQQQRQVDRQQLQQRQDNLPIQSGPGEARQTQPPRQGYYQDQNNGYRGSRGDNRPNDHWTGRPDGHGNGWGPGPQYRPGHVIDRVPGSYSRVPYRGLDYYYSDGYWYRPQGPRYVIVTPPYGVRVRSLPAYSQEVWIGSSLFFVAAGTYYSYQQDTQDYVVAYPPQNVEPVYTPQAPASSPYDPVAYPNNGQSAEQVAQDKYDCYRWSVEQSSFDPAEPNVNNAPAMIQVYRRSMVACLMGRGYTIN
ncbi:DUF6515 family protein [Pseudomonas syringae group sp. J309-1]|uniref:DUF6515 family protein n=1 Tax=Pseudomonas syringae group sp. J309-1 TaxID=3079588 RepID=UPI00210C0360|nr:DUF6515 family protein [Pseudomonas syringae group sp. J309-1]MCQ2998303.1 hypothetical protein [Pseudomonas syringae]MDU8361637.1 DUF6515 family protein [Pseudomonas syringae group sp. J309-1]